MTLTVFTRSLVIVLFALSASLSNAATSMKDQLKLATAMGALCKSYAEDIGRDSSNYANMNIQALMIADKMGYTSDFDKYKNDINVIKSLLNEKLMSEYDNVIEIHDNWCHQFYSAFKKRLEGN